MWIRSTEGELINLDNVKSIARSPIQAGYSQVVVLVGDRTFKITPKLLDKAANDYLDTLWKRLERLGLSLMRDYGPQRDLNEEDIARIVAAKNGAIIKVTSDRPDGTLDSADKIDADT